MAEKIIIIVALCITAAILGKVLEKYNKEQALFLTIAACTAVTGFIFIYIAPVIDTINELFEKSGTGENYSSLIIKSLGICYISQLGYDICKDCNENSLATVIEISAKVTLIIMALPLIEKLADMVSGII